MGTENRKGPLKDVKVLDFTIALAGVYVAWQFADMGAEVWKVERYGSGDQARTWDPMFLQRRPGKNMGSIRKRIKYSLYSI